MRSHPPTLRELDILALAALGLTNREIGRELLIAEETVKHHMKHLLRRLGAKNRTHAVLLGLREGWLDASSLEPIMQASSTSEGR